MKIEETELSGVIILEPQVFGDARGFFLETWNQARYAECGLPLNFVQDNLSFENKRQFYIPEGFAHGFCVTSETALFAYKCTELYHPQHEYGVSWNDPDLGINWPVKQPLLSEKDQGYPRLKEIESSRLPQYQE